MAQRRIAFARINRRVEDQGALGLRPFSEDMRTLADTHDLQASVPDTLGDDDQRWVAADLHLDATGTFVTGVIGFSTTESIFHLDDETFSWVKGQKPGPKAASERSMVPFAVDLRNDRRWVAFGTAQRIRPARFANAFQAALNNAVQANGLFPSEWEVDLVTAQSTVSEWLREHPQVVSIRRVIRYPNPVRDLQGVRAEMAELAARVKREEYIAPVGGVLRPEGQLGTLLEGVEDGNTDLRFESRGDGGSRPRFNTRLASDEEFVDNWGDDYKYGMDLVMGALAAYSARRAGEQPEDAQQTLAPDRPDAP